MFAAGDVVNQPLIDVTTEIANLSRSGLAPVQILEKLVLKTMMSYYTNSLLNINLKYIILVIEELLQKKWGHH